MDRIINVKVGGNHLSKDSNNAGTRGEGNVTTLRITFGEEWDGYSKSVLFWDAHGLNPTRSTLTDDLLETNDGTANIFLVPIPQVALGVAGEMTYEIEGYLKTDGKSKRQKSIKDTLEVKDGLVVDNMNDPTPSQAEQIQQGIEHIRGDIQKALTWRNEAETFAGNAEGFAINAEQEKLGAIQAKEEAEGIKKDVEGYIENAMEHEANAATYESNAREYASRAEGNAGVAVAAANRAEQTKEKVETLKQETIDAVGACVQVATNAMGACVQEATNAMETAKQETVEALEQEATEALGSIKQEAMSDVENAKQEANASANRASSSANRASSSADNASGSANLASQKAQEAKESAKDAKESAEDAEEFANRAENALIKTAYIGANGNWYAWDSKKNEYYDTGVKAQAGSEVYFGNNPPASADVWVKPDGGPDDIMSRLTALEAIVARLTVRTTTISLLASAWVEDGTGCYQVVEVPGVTSYSKVDLQPTAEQLAIFYEKDASFVTENDGGTITVYCIGTKPTNDYIIQATITEVTEDA